MQMIGLFLDMGSYDFRDGSVLALLVGHAGLPVSRGLADHQARPKPTFARKFGTEAQRERIEALSAAKGRLMTVVPIAGYPIDRSWWCPLGMRASGSHVVDFTGVIVEPDAILSNHDDYGGRIVFLHHVRPFDDAAQPPAIAQARFRARFNAISRSATAVLRLLLL
jgi:hypothetical protein